MMIGDISAMTAKKLSWQSCTSAVEQCLHAQEAADPVAPVVNVRSVSAQLCGLVGLVRSRPVPLAFAPFTVRREAETALVSVRCGS
jgi:hypothetical protein